MVTVGPSSNPAANRGQSLLERRLVLSPGDADARFQHPVGRQDLQAGGVEGRQQREGGARRRVLVRSLLLGVRQGRLVAMVAVGDENRERLQSAVNCRMERTIGDRPQAVLCPLGSAKRDSGRALADDVHDVRQCTAPSFVQEPERLEAYVGGPKQRQAVFFLTPLGALLRGGKT